MRMPTRYLGSALKASILCITILLSSFEGWKANVDLVVHLQKAFGDELGRDLYPNIDEIDRKVS